ncbi:hypothetical protein AVEN_218245-1 [Araneus ventricosus]|uniref:Uncharacterized protein n=1 Tax=Araneus ventricosus TaxID=182803 RepID=A0A4Y2MA68_ARAVE|nr:hypothetical protein AVEN_218245-1 [Araneus ventricosus]
MDRGIISGLWGDSKRNHIPTFAVLSFTSQWRMAQYGVLSSVIEVTRLENRFAKGRRSVSFIFPKPYSFHVIAKSVCLQGLLVLLQTIFPLAPSSEEEEVKPSPSQKERGWRGSTTPSVLRSASLLATESFFVDEGIGDYVQIAHSGSYYIEDG